MNKRKIKSLPIITEKQLLDRECKPTVVADTYEIRKKLNEIIDYLNKTKL